MIYSQRIFWPHLATSETRTKLFEFLGRHREICQQISFFTEGDGMDWRFLTPEEVEKRAEILTAAVAEARAAGFEPVINVLNTLGHSDEGGPDAPSVPWQGMLGVDGSTARQCSCPYNADFLDYVKFKYQKMAQCGANLYWIDDDIRLHNHKPVERGCFCDDCLAHFSSLTGRSFSRVELVEALKLEHSVRRQWKERNARVMQKLLDACKEGVYAVNPQAEIGFMLCDITDLHDWSGEKVTDFDWIRPGGGFWNDSNPRSLLDKVQRIGNSISAYPANVKATHEIENYPYIHGEKSAYMTGLECLVSIAATRLDGLMFNILDPVGNDLAPFDDWFASLREWQPKWDRVAEIVHGTLPVGWRATYSNGHYENHRSQNPDAMSHIGYTALLALQCAGLPITTFAQEAEGHLLSGAAARGMSDAELKSLLQKPLLMDASAAQCFIDAGLGENIGIQSMQSFDQGVWELFSDHALNGEYAGYRRSATLQYFGAHSFAFETAPETQILSWLCDYNGKQFGAAFTLYEGGPAPISVMGHFPWTFLLSQPRVTQLQNLSAYALKQPFQLHALPTVAVWKRLNKETGRQIIVLFNAGFDAASVRLQGATAKAIFNSNDTTLTSHQAENSFRLAAWSVLILEL